MATGAADVAGDVAGAASNAATDTAETADNVGATAEADIQDETTKEAKRD
jgi:hypothetical protein